MVLCPVAIAVGCRKCPVFKICPVKSVIGDYKPDAPATPEAPAKTRAAGNGTKRKSAGNNRKGARARRPRK